MRQLSTLILLFFSINLSAQNYWKTLDKEDGLATDTILDVAAGPNKVFLATSQGFSVFENNRFRNFFPINSDLPDASVRLLRQLNDTAYFVTDSGLTIFYDNNFFNYNTSNGLITTAISDIEIDSKGELWIGSEQGLVRKMGSQFIRDSSKVVFDLGINAGDSVYAIVNFDAVINLPSPVTVEVYDGNRWQAVYDSTLNPAITLPTLYSLSSGRVGIASTTGADRIFIIRDEFTLESRSVPSTSDVNIGFINDYESNKEDIYWATFKRTSNSLIKGGLMRLDSLGEQFYDVSLPTVLLNALDIADNIVYIASDEGFIFGSDTLSALPNHAELSNYRIKAFLTKYGNIEFDNGALGAVFFLDENRGPLTYSMGIDFLARDDKDKTILSRSYNGVIDFNPGPIGDKYDLKRKTIYTLSKEDINFHLNNRNNPGYVMNENIRFWPANGDLERGESSGVAPFIDLNNNGCYDPENGDYPSILGDKAVYIISNDANGRNAFEDDDIGIEQHLLAYLFDSTGIDFIDNSIFFKYYLFNKSAKDYNLNISIYSDFEIGAPYDNLFGCVPSANIFYGYKANTFDVPFNGNLGYDSILPAAGIKLINRDFFSATPQSLSSSKSVSSERGTRGPQTKSQWENRYNGKWVQGIPYTFGGDGYDVNSTDTVKFLFPGDPQKADEWSMINSDLGSMNGGGDIDGFGFTGEIPFKKGEFIELDYVFSVGYDSSVVNDNLTPINLLIDNLNKAANFQQGIDSIRPNPTFSKCFVGQEEEFIAKAKENSIFLFPNPSSSNLNILASFSIQQLQIFDVQGRLMLDQRLNNQNDLLQISLNELKNNGIYFIRLLGTEGEIASSSFILNR